MSKATDAYRIAKAHTPLGDKLLFREMSGREEISRPFDYRLEVLSEDDSTIDPKAVLGRGITVELEIQGGGSRYIDTQCTRFAYVGVETVPGRNTKFYRYEARLRPWTHYMTLQSTCRVFQNKTVPDIIGKVLEPYPFPVDFRLSRDYRTWEYCVQYQETDFNFMSRLLENEGIYYFFEHSSGSHKLVFADHIGAHSPLPSYAKIPHLPSDKMVVPDEEYIDYLQMVQEMQPGEVALRDFDFKRTAANLNALAIDDLPYPWGDKEIFEWPGGYWDPKDGTQYASTRLEELQQPKERVTAQSTVRGLTPGYLFTLERCPRRDQNREYLLLIVDLFVRNNPYHTGTGRPAEWQFSFIAQPSQQPYRPARLTPKPRTTGPQTAIVAGLKNNKDEEIVCDEYGRVRVQFNWDREHDYDEESSCWIRVSSGWAGNNWGQISIPRVNQEVIVDFLNGDPDYPIIIGRVYNNEHKVPYALPRWKEYSTWKSRSTKHGGNNDWNEIRFYDYKGKEQVFIHCQWRMDVRVKWNKYETVKESSYDCIGKTYALTVGGGSYHHVGGDHVFEYNGAWDGTVDKNFLVGAVGDAGIIAKGKLDLYSGKTVTVEGVTSIVLKVGANFIEVSPAGVTIQGTMVKINSGGGAAGVADPEYDSVVDCQHADTGEPGYLDKPYKGGGGPPKKKKWTLDHAPPFTVTKQPNGDLKLGNGITIKKDPADPSYQDKVLKDLTTIGSTKTGSTMLNSLDQSGKQTNIHSYAGNPASPNAFAGPAGGNFQDASGNGKPVSNGRGDPVNGPDGKQLNGTGKGTDVDVSYNPKDWPNNINAPNTPGDVILEHEMTHGDHMAHGTYDGTKRTDNFHTNEEKNTIGPENEYRDERGVHRRTDHTDL